MSLRSQQCSKYFEGGCYTLINLLILDQFTGTYVIWPYQAGDQTVTVITGRHCPLRHGRGALLGWADLDSARVRNA